MLLHICLCLVTVIQLTPSQALTDIRRQENDVIEVVVNNCGRSERLLSQLETSVSRMETACSQQDNNATEQEQSQLVTSVSRMEMKISQLVASVSQMETAISQQLQGNNATEQVLGQLMSAVAQLQSDVAELKSGNGHDDVTGKSIQLTCQAEMLQQQLLNAVDLADTADTVVAVITHIHTNYSFDVTLL